MDIAQHNFLITGAASGLGFATARHLIAAGANVVMSDQSEMIERCAAELGEQAFAHRGDITKGEDVQEAIALAVGLGGLHGVIHCAGIISTEPLLDSAGNANDLERLRRVIDINLIGTLNVLRLSAATMRLNTPTDAEGERGVFLMVSSVTAFDGGAQQCGYASSKAAVAGLTLPAARELGVHGIRVVTIAPGPATTPMLAGRPQEHLDGAANMTPFPKRLVRAEDFSRLAAEIVENVMLNGEVIRLDGGIRLR